MKQWHQNITVVHASLVFSGIPVSGSSNYFSGYIHIVLYTYTHRFTGIISEHPKSIDL